MAWYDDERMRTYVGVFESLRDALREAELAAPKGWTPGGAITTPGHVNAWRTAARIALVVPFVAGGPSRSPDGVKVTFTRTPEWRARAREQRDPPAAASEVA